MSVYIPTFETKNKSQFLTQDENATGLNQGQMIHFCDGDCNEQKDEKLAWKSWIDNNRLPNDRDALAKSEPFLVFCITNATIGFREHLCIQFIEMYVAHGSRGVQFTLPTNEERILTWYKDSHFKKIDRPS